MGVNIEHSSGCGLLVPTKNLPLIFAIDLYENIYNNYLKPRIKPSRIRVNHDHDKTFLHLCKIARLCPTLSSSAAETLTVGKISI